ncbi:MAG: Anaerobic nitric oxide reductase transcription regulator NorR [Desulfovibrio sp.]
MIRTAFLIPYAPMAEKIESMPEVRHIHVERCPVNGWFAAATKLANLGYEIVITRTGTAARIRHSGLPLTVVEMPVTAYDILRAVAKAHDMGRNIALTTHSFIAPDVRSLLPFLTRPVRCYATASDDASIEALVLQAVEEGADVIVGGGLFCQMAEKHGIPASFIDSGEESIHQALAEAGRLQEAWEEERAKRRLFSAVLDFTHEGIITLDTRGEISTCNRTAQDLFGLSAAQATGMNIDALWPEPGFGKRAGTDEEELNGIAQLNGRSVLYNMVPIAQGSRAATLVTFQEVREIQQAEAVVRKAIYSKGHTANASFSRLAGKSPVMARAVSLAKEYAATHSNVLIVGETGTGKELFAQSIHNHSARRKGPFVAVNCAALPTTLLESELFGYAGGAFTGAAKDGKMGLFELAHGGTIFLDEVSEMDYANQSRLLRVLQERSVMRLGSDRVINVDVRVVAAANKNLKKLVREGDFREDLFFRLNVLRLELPPLRARQGDIRLLAEDFLRNLAPKGRIPRLSPSAVSALAAHPWPGNVRELRNTMERLAVMPPGEVIQAAHVADVLEEWDTASTASPFHAGEIRKITEALERAGGVQSKAAHILGVDRSTLWRKMRRFGIRIR